MAKKKLRQPSGKQSRSTSDRFYKIPKEVGFEGITNEYERGINDLLNRLILKQGLVDWNRIYFEVWLDSGRVIIYPHKRGKSRSDRPFTFQIESLFVLSEYDKLPDTGNESMDETYFYALQAKVLKCIDDALVTRPVKKLLKALRERIDFTLWFQERDNPETLVPLD